MKLPKIIEKYFEAENAHDLNAALACFDRDAVVHDTGENLDMTGIAAIRKWKKNVTSKYKLHIKPLQSSVKGQDIEVLTEISGSFDGSPLKFRYDIKLKNDKIVFLSTKFS